MDKLTDRSIDRSIEHERCFVYIDVWIGYPKDLPNQHDGFRQLRATNLYVFILRPHLEGGGSCQGLALLFQEFAFIISLYPGGSTCLVKAPIPKQIGRASCRERV